MMLALLRRPLALLSLLLLGAGAPAAEGPPSVAPPVVPPTVAPPLLLPPLVYAPVDQLPPSLLTPAVVLPTGEVGRVWEALVGQPGPAPAPVLGSLALDGSVDGEVLTLTAALEVMALADGRSVLPLPTAWALQQFAAADPRVAVERTAEALRLHLPGAGRYPCTATIAVRVDHDQEGACVLTVPLPSAAVGTLQVVLPGPVSELTLAPSLARRLVAQGDHTRVEVTLGAGAEQVQLRWRPAQESVGAPVLLLQEVVQARVSPRSLHAEVDAEVTVVRHRVSDLDLQLPAGMQLLALGGPAVQTWTVTGSHAAVHLSQPLQGATALHLSLEQPLTGLEPGSRTELRLGVPQLAAAERTTGTILLVGDAEEPPLLTLADQAGYTRIDPRTVGSEMGLAVAFLAPPPPLALTVERRTPDVEATELQVLRLGADEDRLELRLALEVREAGIYSVSGELPQDWELVDVQGTDVLIASSRLVASGPGMRRLLIAFQHRVEGSCRLVVRLRAPPSLPHTAAGPLALGVRPAVVLREAHTTHGTIAVLAPPGWSLNATDVVGLDGEEREPLAQEGPVAGLLSRDPDEVLALAFSWRTAVSDGPATPVAAARLQAVPRPREVDLREEEAVAIAEGDLHQRVDWRGEVRYSALPSLRLQAPSAWEEQLLITGDNIADHPVVARDGGLTTWEVRFDRPVLGRFHLQLERHQPLAPLPTTGDLLVQVASPTLLGDARLHHVLAVTRAGPLAITATHAALAELAPGDVPATLAGSGVVAAFQGTGTGSLHLRIARRDDLRLADAAVTSASYQAVLAPDGVLRVEGVLHLAHRGRPSLEVALPAQARLLEVVVDGLQGRPVRQADGTIVIPLPTPAQEGEVSHVAVALVYEQALAEAPLSWRGRLAITLPALGDERQGRALPVEQAWLQLFVPETLCALGWRGDLLPREEALPSGVDEGEANLTVHIAPLGEAYRFERIGNGGDLQGWYLSEGALWLAAGIAVVVGIALAVLAGRRRPSAPALFALSTAVVAAAVGVRWTVPAALPLAGLAAGAALPALVRLARAWPWRRREDAVRPPPIDDDPWLEAAAPLPAAPSAGPVAEAPPPRPPTAPEEPRPPDASSPPPGPGPGAGPA